VTVWLVVAVIKSVRMAAGWSYLGRMRREGLAAQALWVERVDVLGRQLGVRQAVKLVGSALVRVPVVIGQLRPIIYIPLGLINHLPASEMEAVLLHELAHIRRYDHFVNMVQQAVECLLFFNPGFLWISSLIREERENSCDDIAIAHMRDRVEFVRALVRFKEHSIQGMVLAFPGNKRQLLHRVLRISRQENKTLSGRERLVLLGGSLVLLCMLAARVDVKKKAEPVAETRLAAVQLAEAPSVKVVPKEMVTVLQEREQVAQNMEWVKAQLDQLHHKPGVKKKPRVVKQEAMNAEREAMNADQEVERAEQAAKQSQAEQNRQQAGRDREQAERDRQQAEMDRQQAERDRHQAELDRQQADKDREQGARERQQGEQDRQKSELMRKLAEQRAMQDMKLKELELERQRAEQDRRQAEQDRQQAERDHT
jgi:bla regulator protein blaR1